VIPTQQTNYYVKASIKLYMRINMFKAGIFAYIFFKSN